LQAREVKRVTWANRKLFALQLAELSRFELKRERAFYRSGCLCSAVSQDGLEVIDNPGGSQVVYDPVVIQTTLPGDGAMIAVLLGCVTSALESGEIGRQTYCYNRLVCRSRICSGDCPVFSRKRIEIRSKKTSCAASYKLPIGRMLARSPRSFAMV
jgi:hypothetical protein